MLSDKLCPPRIFSDETLHPSAQIEWEKRTAEITGDDGKVVFKQEDVLAPKAWSELATKVVVSKYFYGEVGTPAREYSIGALIDRVCSTIARWGAEQGYLTESAAAVFCDELSWLCLNQYAAFNSPVWFNVGLWDMYKAGSASSKGGYYFDAASGKAVRATSQYEYPQTSACFIQSVDDNMESIMQLATNEAMLFKFGSGTGSDLSTIRSSREKLSGGGRPSGPMSFLRIYDQVANVVKSGGKCLAANQPVWTSTGLKTAKELADSGKDFICLSYDPPTRQLRVKTARAWAEGIKQVVRVTTDKGVFELSSDHPMRLSSHEYSAAGALQPGMSLHAGSVDDTVFAPKENSQVMSVEILGMQSVYDVEVDCHTEDDKSPESGHNFMLFPVGARSPVGSGVFVSNTRRAAKMNTLRDWHGDIDEFISAKMDEEKKAWALIEQGYDGNFNGPAYGSVMYQNENLSVRVTDEFMSKATSATKEEQEHHTRSLKGELLEKKNASDMLNKIAEGTWTCGDPGLQFDGAIQKWHTCKNSGAINSSNPCVTGDTLVSTRDGLVDIKSLVGTSPDVTNLTGELSNCTAVFQTGRKEVFRLATSEGYSLKLTADHNVYVEGKGDVPASDLVVGDKIRLLPIQFGKKSISAEEASALGWCAGEGCVSGGYLIVSFNKDKEVPVAEKIADFFNTFGRVTHKSGCAPQFRSTSVAVATGAKSVVDWVTSYVNISDLSHNVCFKNSVYSLDKKSVANILRALFSADGCVACYSDKSQYISLDSSSETLLEQVQVMLLGFGVKSKLYYNRRTSDEDTLPDGKGGTAVYKVQQMHSLRISRNSRVIFEREIGFEDKEKHEALSLMNKQVSCYTDSFTAKFLSLVPIGVEDVYDLTEPKTAHFCANGMAVHNCSEFLFLDDTACNLASLNLMKFSDPHTGVFDYERFTHAVRLLILAQDILIDRSSYPTEKIAINSHDFRPLGLGYANLGALLMSRGIPYDSELGRSTARDITSTLTATAYEMSALIASVKGPFAGYEANKRAMLEVISQHASKVAVGDQSAAEWKSASDLGSRYGFRNSQVTVLAPTGTIAFLMDCDTTGIEPDIALVKYKLLAGGGSLKITNASVSLALKNLGYSLSQIASINAYITKHDTIEDVDGAESPLNQKDLPVFDCAFRPAKGTRSIHYTAHLKMMAAVQPFISGAISKTVNMPNSATVEDIRSAYVQAWAMGLKCVAIYRDGSKRSQPLNTSSTKESSSTEPGKVKPYRSHMPDTRRAITHKFDIAGHEGYLTVGFFDDGRPGELFVQMAKEGSTIGGLMDTIGTLTSIALQYGVPVNTLVEKFSHQRFEPSGFTKNPEIRNATSIIDYVFRWMSTIETSTATVDKKVEKTVAKTHKSVLDDAVAHFQQDAPACHKCGHIVVRNGSCYKCNNCGESLGCS